MTSTYPMVARVLVLAVFSAFGTGCASELAAQNGPVRWERRVLADGVELQIREDAGPEAQRVAEQIQSEMRSRYLSARR